jgi:hypothetical protein
MQGLSAVIQTAWLKEKMMTWEDVTAQLLGRYIVVG